MFCRLDGGFLPFVGLFEFSVVPLPSGGRVVVPSSAELSHETLVLVQPKLVLHLAALLTILV